MPRSRLRILSKQIEQLSAGRFILLVGAIGGVLRSYPASYVDHATAGTALTLAVVTGLAAVLLWWVSVRRRRSSIWMTALHVMLALDLADALGLFLTVAMMSLDERGHLVGTLMHQSVMSFLAGFVPPYLVLSPIRFLVAAAAVAVGRQLPGSGQPVIPPPLTSSAR